MNKILASGVPARWWLPLCGLLALLAPVAAQAHNTRLSSSQLVVSPAAIDAVVEVNGVDLEVALSMKLTAQGGTVEAGQASAERDRIYAYLLERARPLAGGQPCAGQGMGLTPKADHLLINLRWTCPSGARLDFEATLFQEIDPAARHMLTARGDAKAFALLSASNTRVALSAAPSRLGEVLWRYFLSGVEHIAIGFDHIAFLIAVILWGRRFWPLAAAVTAFTAAHSITLSLAALDLVSLPSKPVETLIALSIVYVAVENFFVRDIGRRWIITFVFGLIHGFGFASVLREYGMPQDRIGWALAAFNVGVEAGQLVIVAGVFALLYGVGRLWPRAALDSDRRQPFVWTVSGVILLLGLYWAAERIFDW